MENKKRTQAIGHYFIQIDTKWEVALNNALKCALS